MDQDPTCIFCKIAAGEAEASIVFQDEVITAFLDLMPATPGHTLVIPNRHFARLADVDAESSSRMIAFGARLTDALPSSGLPCEAVNLYLADGAAAGQVVMHTHLHVIPRFSGDGLPLRLGPKPQASRAELEGNAASIRAALEALS